jgi:putative ABC transport system permease protein
MGISSRYAQRARLFSQVLTESLLLSLLGGFVGILFAVWIKDGLLKVSLWGGRGVSSLDPRIDWRVLGFTLGLSLLTGLVFGLAPALHTSQLELGETLKEGGRSAASGRHRLRRGLVMVEFGLALALLAGGGLAIHSFLKLVRLDLGFRTERLLVFDLPVPETRLRDPDAVRAFYRRLLERVEAVPGVKEEIKKQLLPKKQQEALDAWIKELKAAANIEINQQLIAD